MSSVASSTAATTLIHDDEPWDDEAGAPRHLDLSRIAHLDFDPANLPDDEDADDSAGVDGDDGSSAGADSNDSAGGSDLTGEDSAEGAEEPREFDPYEESTGARAQACGVAQAVFVATLIVLVAVASA